MGILNYIIIIICEELHRVRTETKLDFKLIINALSRLGQDVVIPQRLNKRRPIYLVFK